METEYASKGVAGSGLGLGIAGTVLGLMNAHGGGWGGFGGANGLGGVAANAAGGAMILDIARKDAEIAQLKADAATDKKLVEVYTTLAKNDKELTGKVDDLKGRVLAIETAMPLREKIVFDRIDSVADASRHGIAGNSHAIAALNDLVGSFTKTIIPRSAICPEVMRRYNSWVAPTDPAPDAASAAPAPVTD